MLSVSGILTEKHFNRIRIFRGDQSSRFVGALMRFYSEWKEAGTAPYPVTYG